MGLADWIFIGILLLFGIGGLFLGFGGGIELIASKIGGVIIPIIICYFFGGMVLDIPFINDMMKNIAASWSGNVVLTNMHLEIIIYYILFFVITMIAVKLLAKVLKGIFNAEGAPMPVKVVNKVLGAVLMMAFALLLTLFVFQIIYWIGGGTAEGFETLLATNGGEAILHHLYSANPMAGLAKLFVS